MRPESLKRAGRSAALTVSAIAVLSLLSFAPWNSDQNPAQAQDVLVVPKDGGQASGNSSIWNLFAPAPKAVAPQAAVVTRPVQGPLPPQAPMLRVPGMEEPMVAVGASVPEQEAELQQLIEQYAASLGTAADFAVSAKPFEDFVAKYPNGPWTMSVLANLGFGYFRDGYFSRALAAWEQAWPMGKDSTVNEVKGLADKVMGQRIELMSRVGRPDAVKALLDEIVERPLTGAATESESNGRQALIVMRHQWSGAYLCGPMALRNVLFSLKAGADQIKTADDARSGPNGFSLPELSALATQAGLKHKLIKREPGQPVPVPSVVNWKLHHYAAITREENGKYRIEDPTYGYGSRLVTREALDDEGSGYYLVPDAAKASGEAGQGAWREVDAASDEAKAVYGRGAPPASNPLATHQCSTDSKSLPRMSTPATLAKGMCADKAQLMPVSVTIKDTPVGYTAAKGTSVNITLTYNQREASQPTGNFTWFNFGKKWNMNWQSHMFDSAQLFRYWGGGGGEQMWDCSYTTGVCRTEMYGGALIKRVPGPPSQTLSHYEVKYPDGSKDIYGLPDATGGTRRIFLTQKIDAQGNATTLTYDSLFRLTTITDATGKATTFCYDPSGTTNCTSGTDLKVYRITDPFGRYTSLTYNTNNQLATITDTVGITSSFTYDSAGLITQMTTPYGNNSYSFGESSGSVDVNYKRWLETTDALGGSDWIEYNNANQTNVPEVEPTAEVPSGMQTYNGTWYWQSNTFYFDKHVNGTHGHTDYTKALLMRWATHWYAHAWAEPVLRNLKPALERKIWFNYKGQSIYDPYSTVHTSGYSAPTAIGRVLDNGTSQVYKADYYVADSFSGNNLEDGNGALLSTTDPTTNGRTTVYEYDSSDRANLTKIKQKISSTPTYDTLAEFTYDSNHNVLSKTDAAGQVWRYAYNSAGQLIYATNPLDETQFWEYDSSARLTRVTVPMAVAHASVTYGTTNTSAATATSYNYTSACSGVTAPDNTNLPISVTDSDGYVKCYEYDDLDRVTKVKYPDGTTDLYDYTFPSGLSSQPTWTTGTVPTAGDPSLDVWKVTDRQSRVTEYVYDRNRRLIKSTQKSLTINGTAGVDRTTSYAYYANGVLKELTDANGNVTRWDIDIQSRPTSKTYAYGTANAKTESYTYDITGRLKTVTDALGQVKTYGYSVADEVTSITYTNHADTNFPTPDVSFTYDTWYPRLATMTDMSGLNGTTGAPASATTTFTYVAPGTSCAPPSTLTNCGALQLREETNNGYYNQHTAYYYDAAGRMSQRWAAETQEAFGYDTLGRLNSYNTPLGTFTLGYLNNTGQLASRSVTNSSITLSQSYGYDTNTNDRRLLTITASSNAMRSYTLGYANGGGTDRYNIRSVVESTASHPIGAQSWAHNYDGGDRLLSSVGTLVSGSGATSNAGTYGWELDKLDNPTKATYPDFGGYSDYPTYLNTATPPADNNLNQMNKNAWWQGYTYDANGNTTAEVDLNSSSAPLRTYKWDMEGRLLQMTDPNVSGGHTVRFHYDGMGRRILQKITHNGTTTYRRFQWCGDRICQQRPVSGTSRTRSYLLTGEHDFTASKKYVYFTDHLGSVRDLADADTGARVGALDYTPYGAERAADGTLPDFRYAGLMWIGDMGLYLSSTRAYDPGAMRWLNRDWIGEAGGINLYGYVGGNPINAVDPEGTTIAVIGVDSPGFIEDYEKARDYLMTNPIAAGVFNRLMHSRDIYIIRPTIPEDPYGRDKNVYSYGEKTIYWNSRAGLICPTGIQSPAMGLIHELGHGDGHDQKIPTDESPFSLLLNLLAGYASEEEKRVIQQIESPIAGGLGEVTRPGSGSGGYKEVPSPVPTIPK